METKRFRIEVYFQIFLIRYEILYIDLIYIGKISRLITQLLCLPEMTGPQPKIRIWR